MKKISHLNKANKKKNKLSDFAIKILSAVKIHVQKSGKSTIRNLFKNYICKLSIFSKSFKNGDGTIFQMTAELCPFSN